MISRANVNGIPRPVGTTYRQRTIYAHVPERKGSPFDSAVPWIVSVVDTLRGPMVEAYRHHWPLTIVATDLHAHSASIMEDVLIQTRDLLDADGWAERTVLACQVPGCDQPLPLWVNPHDFASHRRGMECLSCSIRSVLACRECGAPDPGRWFGREALLQADLCMLCAHWADRVGSPPDVITPDWDVYGIGKGTGPSSCKGFGGAKWIIRFMDGSVRRSDDLWSSGTVPPWFRDRFTPNATIERDHERVG